MQKSDNYMRTHTDKLESPTGQRSSESLRPNWAESSALVDTDDQDYLLDLDWNSEQDEEPSKEPDNERPFEEDPTLLGHHSLSSLIFSDRAEGPRSASGRILDLDLDLDSNTEISGLENHSFQISKAYIYSRFRGRPPISGNSSDLCSPSSSGFDMLFGGHEAASSAASGSRDILCGDIPIEIDSGRCNSASVNLSFD